MKDYTFCDYKEMIEENLTVFIPEIDHKSIVLYDAMKYTYIRRKENKTGAAPCCMRFLSGQCRRGSSLCLCA